MLGSGLEDGVGVRTRATGWGGYAHERCRPKSVPKMREVARIILYLLTRWIPDPRVAPLEGPLNGEAHRKATREQVSAPGYPVEG